MTKKREPKSMTLQEMRDDAEMRLRQGMDPDAEVVILGNGHTARILATTPIRGKLHLHRSDERNCERFANGVDAFTAFVTECEAANDVEYTDDIRKLMAWLYKKPSKRRNPQVGVCPKCGNAIREYKNGCRCSTCGWKGED